MSDQTEQQTTETAAPQTTAPEGAQAPAQPDGQQEQPTEQPTGWDAKRAQLRAMLEDDTADADGDDEADEGDGDEQESEQPDGEQAEGEDGEEPEQADAPESAEGDAVVGAEAVVRLPGRRDGDAPFELPLGHPKVRAVLEELGVDVEQALNRTRQAANGFMRRVDYEAGRAELDAQREELTSIVEALSDEQGVSEFVVSNVNPKAHRRIAERLLMALPDEDYRALLETIDEWEARTGARETAHTRAENERLRQARDRDAQARATRPSREWANQATVAITRLIPEDMDDSDADDFFQFALTKLQAHVASTKELPKPDDIPALLKQLRVLDRFGLAAESSAGEQPPAVTRQKKPAAAKAAQGKAPNTGATLKARADRRRNAAIAPAGAGSAMAAGGRPPKGQSWEERKAWLRKKLLGSQ